MTSKEAPPKSLEPPKSFDREGGVERVKLARYARWFGIFLITLSVLAWVTLSKRPGVPDQLVAEAVEWAESAPRVPCERPVLFGEATQGTGSLLALVERGGQCDDERCSILVDAIQHERVCAPERHRSDDWIESVLARVRLLEHPSDKLRLIMSAMRALDDFRRGELRAVPTPDDGAGLHASVQQILSHDAPPAEDLEELLGAAETLVATSPDSGFFVGVAAGGVLWALRRGEHPVSRRYPHPRASTVALARLGEDVAGCPDFGCRLRTLDRRVAPDAIPKWRTLLFGARANGEAWIQGNEMFMGRQLGEHLVTIEKQRATERLLAAALNIRTRVGCPAIAGRVASSMGEHVGRSEPGFAVGRMTAGAVTFEIEIETDIEANDIVLLRDRGTHEAGHDVELRLRFCDNEERLPQRFEDHPHRPVGGR